MPDLETEVVEVDSIPASTHTGKGSKYDAHLKAAMEAEEGKAVAVKNPGKSLRNTLYQIIRRRELPLALKAADGKLFIVRKDA